MMIWNWEDDDEDEEDPSSAKSSSEDESEQVPSSTSPFGCLRMRFRIVSDMYSSRGLMSACSKMGSRGALVSEFRRLDLEDEEAVLLLRERLRWGCMIIVLAVCAGSISKSVSFVEFNEL